MDVFNKIFENLRIFQELHLGTILQTS